jgi:2-polyprenyl-3-methyl-5-hydroxy-6-metoxy-1,4-benzoquinol methylase
MEGHQLGWTYRNGCAVCRGREGQADRSRLSGAFQKEQWRLPGREQVSLRNCDCLSDESSLDKLFCTCELCRDGAARKKDGTYETSGRTAWRSDGRNSSIDDLSISVWAFSTLASALEAGLLEALTEARSLADLSTRSGIPSSLVEGMLDVLVALGLLSRAGDSYSSAPDLMPLLQMPTKDSLLADVRTTYLLSQQMIDAAKKRSLAPGWSHTDPELLAAQGQGQGGVPTVHMWVQRLFPLLDGLMERLQRPTATFLDVGAGVAAIAIQMCRFFPTLHVVGLEPQDAPLAEARRNVAAAALSERIELRAQRIEDLTDREMFDLVWLPQMFLRQEALERGLRAAWAALHPGGWILLLAVSAPGMNLDAAFWRLRNVLWGGDPLYPEQVAELLAAADFVRVQVLPTAPGFTPKLIVGQRPVHRAP